MTALLWLVRHPVGAAFLFMLLLSAGSSALAKHEMSVNQHLQTQIDLANEALAREQHNQQIVSEVSNAYENRLSNLNRQLALARLRPSGCVPVSSPTGRLNGSAGPSAGPVGITSESLLNFEGTCHKEVFKLIGLQEFVNKVNAN